MKLSRILLAAVIVLPGLAIAQTKDHTAPGHGGPGAVTPGQAQSGQMLPGQMPPGMGGPQGKGSGSGSMGMMKGGSGMGMHQEMVESMKTMEKSMASAQSEAAHAFAAAMMRMHNEMSITYTNNVDIDYTRGMIAHHRGAIEMAEIVLKYTKDETIKKAAAKIIVDQKAEIADMEAWLQKNSQAAASK